MIPSSSGDKFDKVQPSSTSNAITRKQQGNEVSEIKNQDSNVFSAKGNQEPLTIDFNERPLSEEEQKILALVPENLRAPVLYFMLHLDEKEGKAAILNNLSQNLNPAFLLAQMNGQDESVSYAMPEYQSRANYLETNDNNTAAYSQAKTRQKRTLVENLSNLSTDNLAELEEITAALVQSAKENQNIQISPEAVQLLENIKPEISLLSPQERQEFFSAMYFIKDAVASNIIREEDEGKFIPNQENNMFDPQDSILEINRLKTMQADLNTMQQLGIINDQNLYKTIKNNLSRQAKNLGQHNMVHKALITIAAINALQGKDFQINSDFISKDEPGRFIHANTLDATVISQEAKQYMSSNINFYDIAKLGSRILEELKSSKQNSSESSIKQLKTAAESVRKEKPELFDNLHLTVSL